MSKHTPGPWHYSTKPQPNGCPIIGADGLMIAMLAHSVNIPRQCDTAIANARLIAAAPDLLEALEGTLAETIESRNALHEGASLPDGSYDDPEDAAEIARIDGIIARAQAAIARATGQEDR